MSSNLWISYAFFAASIYASMSLLDKIVSDTERGDPFVMSVFKCLPFFVAFVALGLVTGRTGLGSGSPSAETVAFFLVGAFGGAIYLFDIHIYYKGVEAGDISRLIPILSTDVIFVLVISYVLLGESLELLGYLGVLVIFVGMIVISVDDVTEGFSFASRRAIVFATAASVSFAVFNVILKYLSAELPQLAILFWVGVGGVLSVVSISAVRWSAEIRSARIPTAQLASIGNALLVINGLVTSVAVVAFIRALETGPVSIAVAILKIDVLLVFFGVVVLSYYTPEVLREEMSVGTLIQKFGASVCILAGVVIIQFAS